MKAVRKGMTVILLAFMLIETSAIVNAKENLRLMQTIVTEDSLQIYVDEKDSVQNVTAQIGRDVCDNVEYREMESMGTGIHTMIFLDNSLSITEQNRKKIQELLHSYISHKYRQEAISLYLFGEEAQPLISDSADNDALLEAMDQITYINQDSWLTDVVYDEVKKHRDDKVYTRVVVISDGVDQKSIGYTEEELQALLKETGFPLYAIGCVYKENQERLERFFALSRQTAGAGFLLDDYEDTGEIENAILQDADISCVVVPIPEKLQDGSEKSILIKLETKNGTAEVQTKAQMPFGELERTETVTEPEPETAAETIITDTETVPEKMETAAEAEIETQVDWVTLLALAVIVIAIVVFLVIRQKGRVSNSGRKRGEELKPPGEQQQISKQKPSGKAQAFEKEETRMMDSEETHLLDEEGETQFMGGDGGTDSLDREVMLLRLQDMDRPEKVFQYPVFGEVLIGRAAEGTHIVLDYERSVSGKQCRVFARGDRIFVENLSNVNGTEVNGKKITQETQLHSGDTLKMGRLRMRVELVRR